MRAARKESETAAVGKILDRLEDLQADLAFLVRVWETIAKSRGLTEPTTLSIAEAARVLDVDASTIRRRFGDVLVRVPGGRRDRVPVEKLRSAFVLSRIVNEAEGKARPKGASRKNRSGTPGTVFNDDPSHRPGAVMDRRARASHGDSIAVLHLVDPEGDPAA